MTTPEANRPLTGEPCGGCGETDLVKACLGCRHFVSRPAHPEPERDGAEPWETGADAICAAMIERSAKSIKRVSEDLYETMMIDVQDWLRENVTYNLSSELSRRDHAIASLKALLSTAERQRDEAVRALERIAADDEPELANGNTGDLLAREFWNRARQALQSIGSGDEARALNEGG